MRELLLIRHAKACGASPDGSDFARPLAARGLSQLKELRTLLQRAPSAPDLVLASPASRTRETAEGLLAAFPEWACTVSYLHDLYLASGERIGQILARLPDSVAKVCLVGHNPGLSELAELLTGQELGIPTLGVVAIGSSKRHWTELEETGADLLWHATPLA